MIELKRINDEEILRAICEVSPECRTFMQKGEFMEDFIAPVQAQLEADQKVIDARTAPPELLETTIQLRIGVVVQEIFREFSNQQLLEVGRKAIEDTLVEWRDNRLSEFTRGNGLVIRERDGKDSNIIRFGPETALKIGIKAMLQDLKQKYVKEE